MSHLVQVRRTDGEIPGRVGAFGPKQQHLSGAPQNQRVHGIRSQYKVSDRFVLTSVPPTTALQEQLNNICLRGTGGADVIPANELTESQLPTMIQREKTSSSRHAAGAPSASEGAHAVSHSRPKKHGVTPRWARAKNGKNGMAKVHKNSAMAPYISHAASPQIQT